MQAKDAVEIIQLFEEHGIEVYVDGGWAVDALLGRQTRAHNDLDIALPHRYEARLRQLFTSRGYREKNGPDNWESNFVLADESGHELDVHTYELDEQGNNIYGVEYRREHLTGKGSIRWLSCVLYLGRVAGEIPLRLPARRRRLSGREGALRAVRNSLAGGI